MLTAALLIYLGLEIGAPNFYFLICAVIFVGGLLKHFE